MAAYLTHRPAAGSMLRGFGAPPATPTSPPAHLGQDYGWGGGDTIYAARAGKVTAFASAGAYGNRLIIDHGDGFQTWYCHLASLSVRLGATVAAGQTVAVMGATGNVTAKHLHFELRKNGVAVDPAPYFTGTAGGGTTPLQGDEMGIIRDPSTGALTTVGETTYQHHTSMASYEADALVYGPFRQAASQAQYKQTVANTQVRLAYLKAQIGGTSGSAVDAAAIAAKVEQNLADDFARLKAEIAAVNANIDDQPTKFTVTPA